MPKTDYIEQLRRRLVDLDCPIARVRRLVQEVTDHREDLKQTALAEGLSGVAAEIHADTLLGSPVDLAEGLAEALRRSSWWGRHSIIGFCVLPLLAVPVLWALILFLGLGLVFGIFYALDKNQFQQAADNPGIFHYMLMVAHGADYLALALVTLLFCWLAQRSALRFKWTATACVICSLYALFSWIHITPHSLSLGITSAPHWIRFAIPLVTVALVYAFQRRTAHCYRETVAV
jgi:hypothetical protein